MTWVIGFPSSMGYAAAVADIQVTFTDRAGMTRHVDGLQKIHAVGRWVLAGFCGNVRIGFRLVDDLRAWLAPPADEPDWAWFPEFVAWKWRRRARRIYASLSQSCPGGSALLLAASHPTRNLSGPEMLAPLANLAASYACIMHAPEYEAEPIRDGTVASIGSGNAVETYCDELRKMNADPTYLVSSDIFGTPGMSAQSLAHSIALTVARTPVPGVSRHVLFGVVRRGSITIAPGDYEMIHHDRRREVFRVPPCASDWAALRELVSRHGGASGVQCAQA
jgi:hypothetical protein